MTRRQRRKARNRRAIRLGMTWETGTVLVNGKWRRFRRMVKAEVWTGPNGKLRGDAVAFPRHVTVLVDPGAPGGDHTVMLDTSDPQNVKVWSAFRTEPTVNPFTSTQTITGDPRG